MNNKCDFCGKATSTFKLHSNKYACFDCLVEGKDKQIKSGKNNIEKKSATLSKLPILSILYQMLVISNDNKQLDFNEITKIDFNKIIKENDFRNWKTYIRQFKDIWEFLHPETIMALVIVAKLMAKAYEQLWDNEGY